MFDIIIEDVSNEPEDQIRHSMDVSRFVNNGGIYIIDDDNIIFLEFIMYVLKPYTQYHNFVVHIIELRVVKNEPLIIINI